MKKFMLCKTLFVCSFFISCNGQTNEKIITPNDKIVGGGCDGCELMYIGMPKEIHSVDISSGWNESAKKLIISGTVFQLDGKTPAKDVIIYYWQTDSNGYYAPTSKMDDRTKRHGHIRGWLKTDEKGKYTLKTIRPAPYPNDVLPAHIHLSVKEPDVANEYYIDEINFNDDKLLPAHLKKYPQEKRGGSGIIKVTSEDGLQIAQHNIILGLNIPNYPKKQNIK